MKRKWSLKTCADAIAILHFAWAVFFWGGTVAVIFYRPYAKIQALALIVGFVFKIPLGNRCILTTIEEDLRGPLRLESRSRGSFVATYLNKIFGTKVSAREAKDLFLVLFIISCLITIFALMNP